MIALKPSIKIRNKNIEVDTISIDKEHKTIVISCNGKSYSIFKTWAEIANAHRNSDYYKKENICENIEIDGETFNGCQIFTYREWPDSDYIELSIVFDYVTSPPYAKVLDEDEAIAAMNKLFN